MIMGLNRFSLYLIFLTTSLAISCVLSATTTTIVKDSKTTPTNSSQPNKTNIYQLDARNCSLKTGNVFLDFTKILPPSKLGVRKYLITPEIQNRSMVLSFCSGIDKKSMWCEGRNSSLSAACLYDKTVPLMKLNTTTSTIVGAINQSSFVYDLESEKPELYWISHSKDKNCHENGKSSQTHVKVSFECLEHNKTPTDTPEYANFGNCTYTFRWALSEEFCSLLKPKISTIEHLNNSTPTGDKNKTASSTPHGMPSQDHHDNKTTSGADLHDSTLKQTQSIINNHQSSTTPKPKILDDTKTKSSKMNTLHKVFMTGLIVLSLVGFVIGLLILDRKTQLRIPLGNLAGRSRFNQRSVPYNRMGNSVGSGLDL